MYGGPGKAGRGGGRGSGGQMKRNIHSSFNSSHLHRPVGVGGRLSGPRNTTSTSTSTNTTTAPPPKGGSSAEESFSLVTGNPLNFGMIIRLTPDLVDEIKKAESKGTTPRIRFDANAHNTTGNVIDVGGKDFRFTWSREMGDLCDIYEERQSGEDGNGLLVESGCAWRKLNVQRELDESTKNHVKMRSEEAERKLKSRKAIKLDDHGNPSMKNPMKALAAAEVNTWKMPFKQKKESQPPFKKRKAEPPPVPPKSVHKSGFPSIIPSKGRPSASPLRFTPEQSGAPASPFGTMKTHAHVEDVGRTQPTSKGITTVPEKEIPRVITGAVRDKPGHKSNVGTRPTDLRSLLISVLRENPKGMSRKALEEAVGDTIPNSVKKIEPIIKKIANFQAPGRYLLKPGVELESFKKPSSESGSSPEDNRHQTPALDDIADQIPVSEPIFSADAHRKESDEGAQLNSKSGDVSNAVENIDILFESRDLLDEKKNANNNEGPAGSSSDSGSDSDNGSSDSGSDSGSHSRSRSGSHSRSKSKSPVGSGSGSSSSSDSESDDASSNSKEASDEDVDIMTSDDEKEPNPTLLIQWQTPNGDGPVINGIDENQDGHGSDLVEIEKDGQEAETNKEGEKPVEETKPFSPDRHEHQESLFYTPNLYSEKENMTKDGSEIKSKGKSKRVSDEKQFDDNPQRAKRLKSENVTQQQMSGGRISRFSVSPHSLSPRPIDGPHKGPPTDFGLPKGYNQTIPGNSTFVSQPPGRRSIDLSALPKPPAVVEKPVKYDGFPMQKDKTQGEDGYYTNEQNLPKISKEGGVGDKQSTPVDSQYRKHSELVGKFKEVGSVSNSHTNYSPKDNYRIAIDKSPVINGRGSNSILRRELSDLELGELRESAPNETTIAVKKQSERKGSFKQLENKPSSSDYWNLDSNKGKASGKINADTIKRTQPNSSIGVRSSLEGLSKKRTPEHNVEELARPNHRIMPPQPQNVLRVDHAEAASHFNKSADVNSKTQAIGTTRGIVSHSTKESKKQKSNTLVDLREKQNDTSVTDRDNGRQKKGESSSDEISSSYSKYEKEEAELKGPIKDIYQYEEYVHEYLEKYDVYISVNKVLESYRDEFNKYKEEFEMAKGKDMARCHKIEEQIKEAYRQCKTKHCRLKNIFVVLHEELKRLKEMIKEFADSVDKD